MRIVRGGFFVVEQPARILSDQVAKCADARWVDMRYDPPHGNSFDDFGQQVELGGTLVAVQYPAHVRILHQKEQCVAHTEPLDMRCFYFVSTRRQQIHRAKALPLRLEGASNAVKRQETLFPSWRE